MTKRPNPKTFMMMAAGALVVSAGAVYLPYSRLSKFNLDIAKVQKSIQPVNQVQQQVAQSHSQLASDQDKLKHLEANVSSVSYIPSLLLDLDKFGRQMGLVVTGVRPMPKSNNAPGATADNGKPYDDLDIQVTARGPYKAVSNFVAGLAEFPKIVAARTISMTPTSKDPKNPNGTNGMLDVTVNLKAYVFKSTDATPSQTISPTSNSNKTAMNQAGDSGRPING